MTMQFFDLELITKIAIKTIRNVQIFIRDYVIAHPDRAFERGRMGRRQKPLLTIDLVAESNATYELEKKFGASEILPIGEESLSDENLNLSNEKRLVVLMDMVDGTDLLERGLSNWCSAMVFYYPPEQRIIASFVGIPEDSVYYATEEPESKPRRFLFHVTQGMNRLIDIRGPSNVESLGSASIAFYGQKIKNFLSVARHKEFISHLEKTVTNNGSTRIYNLAGNPMMMKLIDGHTRIDAVFDVGGQAPHDVVPGAYIAQKAQAVFCNFEGNQIDLAKALLRPADPNSRICYLVTSTKSLAQELQEIFSKTWDV